MALTDLFVRSRPAGRTDVARPLLGQLSAQALALVPLVVAVLLLALMLPRGVPPLEIPRPTIDGRALARTVADDDQRIFRLRATPLSAEVRIVGSALRSFNVAEAEGADSLAMGQARGELNAALHVAASAGRVDALLDLRALQMQQFIGEVSRYERDGEVSRELTELGGTFIQRMTRADWCVGHHVLMGKEILRVAFKLTWNKLLLIDADPRFEVTLDETRLLYGFYFAHPHPIEAQRPLLEALRAGVHDAPSARHADDTLQIALASWLMPKVRELAHVDPAYPEPLARAAVLYLHHDYAAAASLYEAWLEAHPSGPGTLRVQNYMRASVLAEEDRLR